jgi:hypothetical protein
MNYVQTEEQKEVEIITTTTDPEDHHLIAMLMMEEGGKHRNIVTILAKFQVYPRTVSRESRNSMDTLQLLLLD